MGSDYTILRGAVNWFHERPPGGQARRIGGKRRPGTRSNSMTETNPLVSICMPHWQVKELITLSLRAIPEEIRTASAPLVRLGPGRGAGRRQHAGSIERTTRRNHANEQSHSLSAAGVHLLIVLLILAGDDAGQPLLVAQVPVDGPGDALLEGDGGLPAQLRDDLAGVDGVPAVVAGPVLDVADQGLGLVEPAQDDLDDLEVRLLVAAADVVDLARGGAVPGPARWPCSDRRRRASRGPAGRRRRRAVPCRSGRCGSSAG